MNDLKLKKTQNDDKMHYKIAIFGACAPYPRLIYWIASSISQGKKNDMTCHQNPGPDNYLVYGTTALEEILPLSSEAFFI